MSEPKSPLSGLSGGSDFNNNTSTHNGNGKQIQKKEKPEIPIYKYTTRFRKPLHEAILLSGQPFFIAYDPSKKYIGCIAKIAENKRILRPPDDSEYPYEPIEFESLSEIKRFTELAFKENIDSLFERSRSIVSLYVDQEPEIIILIAADIVWVWFQDLFPTCHYYDVSGKANGIGKSTIGHVFEGIGYRPARMTDPSSANLFRVLGQIEPGQCIIIADEADRMHQDKDALSILKEGYQINARVPKTNPSTFKQEWFYCYGFKVRIAEESLRSNITKGVIDRSISIKAIKGKPTHDIKEVLNPSSRIPRLEKLHNELRDFRKLMLCYRLIHYNDEQPDIEISGLDGREKELCKPLLQLFHGSRAYDEVNSTIMTFMDRKKSYKKSTSIEPILFELILEMIELKKDTMLLVNDIWTEIRRKVHGEFNSSKPNEFQTYDYDTIYRNTITKVLEGFGAEHDRIHEGRVLIFNPRLLLRTSRQYDISEEAQRRLERIQGVTMTAHYPQKGSVTPSRPQKNVRTLDATDENNDIIDKPESNIVRNERDGVTATFADPGGTAVTDQPTTNSVYRLRPNGDRYGCHNCKLTGDKWFMQEHQCRESKGKLQ
jgi:hypothetical protein